MELKPTDTITISVSDFETKYVSRQAYDALCAELAALKAAARWIPVSERLPLRGQEIWAKETGNHKITRFLYSPELESIFVRHYTHWRELPAPPVAKGGRG